MTAPPMASWSLVASPEYDPGREVQIDCEEWYGLPHLKFARGERERARRVCERMPRATKIYDE
jgi:hypothetical protein